jgi:hypothetical protein
MAFDPSSAQPVQAGGGFDPTTAQPVQQSGGFDPTSARPVTPAPQRVPIHTGTPGATGFGMIGQTIGDLFNPGQPNHDPNALESGIMGVANSKPVQGLSGAYMNTVTHGLFMQPVRQAMESSGYGMDRVKQLYPNATPQEQQQLLHQFYNQAVDQSRANAQAQVKANPYPGHQVGNFMADVVASPEMLLMPGGGAGSTVARRIASAAVTNDAVGAAADGAAQVMDIAEGQKKDFDIIQNLTQAAMGGLIGGGMRGVHEAAPVVSDFVKGLFGNRGLDTTPSVDPRGNTTPLTGNSVSMTPEEQAQFKGLLRNGSVDDIKNFLNTKQGPKPTWQDVNNLVKFRDQLPDQFVGKDNLNQAVDQTINDHQHQLVSDHVAAQTANWKNAPDIEVVHSPNEIADPAIREEALRQDPNGQALGLFGSDGKARLFSSRIDSPETANAVLYHEALGHYGLQQQFGAGLDSTLNTLVTRNVGKFGDDVQARMKQTGEPQALAAEEVLAEKSQNGPLKPALKDAIVSKLRQFGRGMGLKLAYSDNEIQHILSMAHDAVINGKGRDVRANGYAGATEPGSAPNSKWLNMSGEATPNKFMFTGPKATGFDPSTARVMSDGAPRNEISDRDSTFHEPPAESTRPLGDVLDHPNLYEQYPHLRDLPVTHTKMEGLEGAYSPKTKRIYLNTDAVDKHSTVLHEVQHAIQDHEGLTTDNGNMSSTGDEYDKSPIEQEARATEDRQGMTAEQRELNPAKFMTRNQLASDPNYVAKNIESIYDAMEKDYVPTYKSQTETIRDAATLGFSPSQIKDLGKTPELAARLERMRASLNTLDQRLTPIQEKINSGEYTPKDLDQARQIIADQMYIGAKLRDERAEVARALAISKLGYTRSELAGYGEILRDQGGSLAPLGDDQTLVKFLKQMNNFKGNANATGSMMKSLQKPNWEDYLTTLHQNMMLSGVSTHVKAPLDMMIGIGRELMDNAGALPLSAGRAALRAAGINVKEGVHPTEVAARLWGVLKAAIDAETYRNTAKTFIDSGVNPNGFGGKQSARIPGVSKITDLISAQDAFFRAFATNMHLYGMGTRQALQEARANGTKADWDTIMTQGSNYAMNPSAELLKAAHDASNQTLLLNKNVLTEPLDRIKNVGPNATFLQRATAFVANFLTPFIRVESNSLWNRVIRRSPLALFDPQTIRDLKAGGPDADVAMARIVMGTASIAAYWSAAGQKKTTGSGPDNPDKRAELEASGWRPDAVHENGQYNTGNKLAMSFNPFDAHNSTATMVANAREAWEKGANKGQVLTSVKLATMSTVKSLASMSWVNDIAPAVDALTSPNATMEQKVDKFLGNEAQTMVPNLVGQAARVSDQNQPDIRDNPVSGAIASAIPGLREQLPVQYDVYGNPKQGGASLAGQHTWLPQDNRITGGNHVDEVQDPAEKELARLAGLTEGAIITPVQRTITINGAKQKLTTQQFADYQHLAGRAIVETVRQEMSTPQWQQMSDQEKVLEVRDIEKDMKKAAKEHLYGQ